MQVKYGCSIHCQLFICWQEFNDDVLVINDLNSQYFITTQNWDKRDATVATSQKAQPFHNVWCEGKGQQLSISQDEMARMREGF